MNNKIRISFPRTCNELSTHAVQGSLLARMETLLEFNAISKLPTVFVEEGKIPGFGVIVLECDQKDRNALFCFFAGIDFLRNNIGLVS